MLAWAFMGHSLALADKGSDALRSATQPVSDIQQASGAKPAAKSLSSGDSCSVLSVAEVQKGFPGAKADERSRCRE
jgi:hypothetical protein